MLNGMLEGDCTLVKLLAFLVDILCSAGESVIWQTRGWGRLTVTVNTFVKRMLSESAIVSVLPGVVMEWTGWCLAKEAAIDDALNRVPDQTLCSWVT